MSEKYGFEGYYLFTTNDTQDKSLAQSRFFNPGIGIDEDPATGTAAGPLAGNVRLHKKRTGLSDLTGKLHRTAINNTCKS